MRSKVVNHLLSKLDIHPVLIDVGASGAPPEIWERIAQHSIYVGFDPDLREIHEVPESRFYKAIIVNEAVTSDEGSDEVLFYFTKSPRCSSTLRPDSESLSHYLFSDLFIVEKEAKVRAATLDSVMERLSLPRIDWFKTDSQGTDLRLFKSIKDIVRSRVLAVDIEPGLMDAYLGEDLFVDAHREFVRSGFWLSRLDVGGSVQIRRSSLPTAMALASRSDDRFIYETVRPSPGWVNARYLRTLDWLAQDGFTQREYVLLWVFALLDGQLGFAFDLGIEYERLFGKGEISDTLKNEPVLLMKRDYPRMFLARFAAPVMGRVRRVGRQLIGL